MSPTAALSVVVKGMLHVKLALQLLKCRALELPHPFATNA